MSPPSDDPGEFDYSKLTFGDLWRFLSLCRFIDSGHDAISHAKIAKALGSPHTNEKAAAQAMGRFVKRIEDELSAPLFAKDVNHSITGLTECGRRFRKLAEKYESVTPDTEQNDILRLSIAEAAASYLIPEILWERSCRPEKDSNRVTLRLDRSDLAHLEASGKLSKGDIDGAMLWDPSLRGKVVHLSPGVIERPLKFSDVPICLVFHASHPLAKKLTVNPDDSTGQMSEQIKDEVRPNNLGCVVPPFWRSLADYKKGLSGEALHYPGELTALKTLAAKLVDSDHCFRTEGFPAVIAQVRMGMAVGLFPTWPSVLRRLKVEDHVYHIKLPSEVAKNVCLNVYHRNETNQQTQHLLELIKDIEDSFTVAESEDPNTVWQTIGWKSPFDIPDGDEMSGKFRSKWKVYYINRGYGGLPYPKWRDGTWNFGPIDPDGVFDLRRGVPVEGTFTMYHKTMKKYVEFHLSGILNNISLHITSTAKPHQNIDNRPPAIITFLQVLMRGEADRIVFGFIHTARRQTTTVAPFLLCPDGLELSVKELRSICGLVEFHTHAIRSTVGL